MMNCKDCNFKSCEHYGKDRKNGCRWFVKKEGEK